MSAGTRSKSRESRRLGPRRCAPATRAGRGATFASTRSHRRHIQALAAVPIAAIVLLVPVTSAVAQDVKLAPFGGQAFDLPYHVTGAPGDPSRVFVVEGAGTIRLVKNGATQATPFVTIPEVFTGCEPCGLLSMAFAPDYATSGLFYVFYTRDSAVSTEEYYLRIEEFRRSADDPDVADPGSRRMVLEIPHLETTLHNGGQLQFGPDGLLYISVGDAGPQGDPNGHAQSTGTLYGKLLESTRPGRTLASIRFRPTIRSRDRPRVRMRSTRTACATRIASPSIASRET